MAGAEDAWVVGSELDDGFMMRERETMNLPLVRLPFADCLHYALRFRLRSQQECRDRKVAHGPPL